MNTVIWKYNLTDDPVMPVTDFTILEMPEGAELLLVDMQFGLPTVWARVDPTAPKVRRVFHTMNTGTPAPDAVRAEYVGTYFVSVDKSLVFHVFVEPEVGEN